jgi:hypothetical protein
MSNVPILAGMASTAIFAASTLPMLVKAYRTRDLSSYSLGNIVLANVGNVVHSVYVLSLPAGPLWVLHGFYLLSSALMLAWFVRYHVSLRCSWVLPPMPSIAEWTDRPTRTADPTS